MFLHHMFTRKVFLCGLLMALWIHLIAMYGTIGRAPLASSVGGVQHTPTEDERQSNVSDQHLSADDPSQSRLLTRQQNGLQVPTGVMIEGTDTGQQSNLPGNESHQEVFPHVRHRWTHGNEPHQEVFPHEPHRSTHGNKPLSDARMNESVTQFHLNYPVSEKNVEHFGIKSQKPTFGVTNERNFKHNINNPDFMANYGKIKNRKLNTSSHMNDLRTNANIKWPYARAHVKGPHYGTLADKPKAASLEIEQNPGGNYKQANVNSMNGYTTSPSPETSPTQEVPSIQGMKTISGSTAGRLGNQMFKHASLLGLALLFHRTLIHENPFLGNGFDNITSLPSAVFDQIEHGNISKKHTNAPGAAFCTPRVFQCLSEHPEIDHFIVDGYLQAWCFFDRYRDRIRREYAFHKDIVAYRNSYFSMQARSVFSDIVRSEDVTFIGVHIRRGDMVSDLARGRSVADKTYLKHAVQHIENHTSSSPYKLYIVAGFDATWARQNFEAPSPFVFLKTEHPRFDSAMIDLAILAGCNHTIITVGTYGWWAAYLAGGITVYYKNYPVDGTEIGSKMNKSEYYLPEWVGLE